MKERRELLGLLAVTVSSTLAGCFFAGGPESGDLVINNEDETAHTVSVIVSKTSDNPDRVSRDYPPPTPEVTPEWKRTHEFEIGPYQERIEEDLFTEPGAYYVECHLNGGGMAATWLGLYSAGPDGSEVAEELFRLTISDDATLSIITGVDD